MNGQKIKETYGDGSYLTFTYDVYGNNVKKSSFNANGNEINSTEYVYDGDGNIIEAIGNKNGTPYRYTFNEYDAYGRNISVAEINATSKPSDSEVENAKLKYVYNIDDNIAKIYYPNTTGDELKGIAFKYNKDKWITEIDGLLSGDDAAAIRKYEYYSDGKISCIKDFQNFLNKDSDYVERDYSYDVFDRVLSMKYYNSTNKDLILEQYDYEYDKNSNITYKHEKYNYSNNLKDEDVTYTYNKLNQLVESVKNNKLTYKTTTSSYAYDSVGNRTYEKIVKKDTVATDKTFDEATYNYYSYNRLNQLSGKTEVITDGTTTKTYTGSYKYDARGNQIEVTDGKSKTITKYTYDVENQLTDVEVTTDGKKTGEQHNIYNGNGQRISKTDIVIDGDNKKSNTTCYFYEGSLLLYTTDDSGKKISQNVIGNQDNIIVGIRYSGGNQNEYFYAKDVQGSTTNITDNTGACVQSYDYTDFGETAERIATDFENEICYTGGIYDELTGLYYLNARYYNPDEGVFLSQDTYRGTEKNAECWNLYAYCANNPINYVDPRGHTASLIQSGQYLPAEAWESIKKIEKDSNSNNKNNKKKNKLTKVQKLFVAVIAGEAIGEGKKSWKAIAHIIMNRVRDKTHDFKNYNTVTKVIKQPYQFSSYFYKDRQYLKAKNYLKKRKPKNKRYERLIKAVIPIYKGKKKDITKGALLYYSPKSMNPRGSEPSWDFSKLKEIKIKGIASNNFRFYKYK
ncbi:MAG: RHS repeat-associated core domain-containing protein [Eubacterium sp.]